LQCSVDLFCEIDLKNAVLAYPKSLGMVQLRE
jgi:hypothetical protein